MIRTGRGVAWLPPLPQTKITMMNGTIDFPTAEEKQRAILMAFQNGRHMTVNDMQRVGHTTEGRKVVSRLRRMGNDIRSYKNDGECFKHYYLATN